MLPDRNVRRQACHPLTVATLQVQRPHAAEVRAIVACEDTGQMVTVDANGEFVVIGDPVCATLVSCQCISGMCQVTTLP